MYGKATDEQQQRNDRLTVFRKTQLFGSLSDELLMKITGLAFSRDLNEGQILYSEHEEAAALYVIAAGELRSIRQSAEGREQVLSTERPGTVLGLIPVISGGGFYSTVVADTSSKVLGVEKHEICQLCREHMEVLWNVAKVLGHKVRQFADLIESLALRTVDKRLADYLYKVALERGARAGDGCIVELTSIRAEIASRIGSVREVVSRAFAQLQRSGLMKMTGRRLVTIPSMQALSAFAEIRSEESAMPALDLSSDML